MLSVDLKTIQELKEKKAVFIIAKKLESENQLSNQEMELLEKQWDKLPEETLRKIFIKINFEKIFKEKNKLPKQNLNKYLNLALYFINQHSDAFEKHKKIIYETLIRTIFPMYKLDIYYIKYFNRKDPNLDAVIYEYQLNENDIEKFMNDDKNEFLIDWNLVSGCMKLSESFMRKYHKKLSWYLISLYQNFSNEFLKEFYEYLDLDIIEKRIKREMENE